MTRDWVKQLTRENTLLDRGLRVLAYDKSLQGIGQASISSTLIVGQGQVTSLYYLPDDYEKTQQIILREFKGKAIDKMSSQIMGYLEEGYVWAKSMKNKKISFNDLPQYFKQFNQHHAHARGAIVYGYWGEPKITEQLKNILEKKLDKKKIDTTISILSSPQSITGELSHLRDNAESIEKKKQKLIKELKFTKSEQKIVDTLDWFTLFYEMGELVSSYLYDELLNHFNKIPKVKKDFKDLEWYDPKSLDKYFKGSKMSGKEIQQRKDFWIIELINGKWKILSGKQARNFYFLHIPQEVIKSTSSIQGSVACPGVVQGKVKIIITQDDQKKMKQGDILVSPMTTPRLMTAVKKAGAIVTDEGGMTAHAAIISRELNIPCVVGTKIATKVLKDGDKVEVDATLGIVKKI